MRWLTARILFLPTLAWNVLLGRILRLRDWWNFIDEHVIVGALPFAADVDALRAQGVRAVVNMCEEYAGPRGYEQAGIEQVRLPTIDFTPPSIEDVNRGVAFIQHHVARRQTVYVHCKAGRGRSATVALCWLIDARGLTPQQAQDRLIQMRPHVNHHLAERDVVRQFWASRADQAGSAASVSAEPPTDT